MRHSFSTWVFLGVLMILVINPRWTICSDQYKEQDQLEEATEANKEQDQLEEATEANKEQDQLEEATEANKEQDQLEEDTETTTPESLYRTTRRRRTTRTRRRTRTATPRTPPTTDPMTQETTTSTPTTTRRRTRSTPKTRATTTTDPMTQTTTSTPTTRATTTTDPMTQTTTSTPTTRATTTTDPMTQTTTSTTTETTSTTPVTTTVQTLPTTTPPSLCGGDGQPQCSVSVENLAYGQSVSVRAHRDSDDFPSWANLTLASEGQQFMEKYVGAIGLNEIFCLGFLLSIRSVSETLLYTNTLLGALPQKRQWATTSQILLWGRNIFNDTQYPRSEEIVKRSIKRVREIHMRNAINVQYTLENHGNLSWRHESNKTKDEFWDALKKDMEEADLLKGRDFNMSKEYTEGLKGYIPMNQFQYAMTQWTFMGMIVQDSKRALLYDVKDEELIAFNHFWAVLGYMLGVEDEYNIALQKGLEEQKEYYEGIFQTYMIPALYHLNECKPCKVYLELETKWFSNVALTQDPQFPIPQPLTVQGLSMTAVWRILGIPVSNMYRVSPLEAKLFLSEFQNLVAPQSRKPPFHRMFTDFANALQRRQGIAYFGKANYSTQASIADNCHYDFFADHPNYQP